MASEVHGGQLDTLIGFYGVFGFVPIQKESKDSDGIRQRLLERTMGVAD